MDLAIKPTFLLPANQCSGADETLIGGKAKHLARLSREGFSVPPWCVLTTEIFAAHLQQSCVLDAVKHLQKTEDLQSVDVTKIRQNIVETRLAEASLEAIDHAINDLTEAYKGELDLAPDETEQDLFFAVRSSVVGEDSVDSSFAGQMDSFLFQQDREAIEMAVVHCFASAFSERALQYRQQHGLLGCEIQAAVILQVMIEAEVSGVLFTANPTNGQRDEAVISACYGLGEGVVSGACVSDEFVLDIRSGEQKHAQIHSKDSQISFDVETGLGVKEMPVDNDIQDQACLQPEQLQSLLKTGVQIAQSYAAPQDIEWCWQGERFWILQTRPITSLPYPQQRKGQTIVWDNSNIEESYCGVCRPLTLSFARDAHEAVYLQTMRTLGLNDSTVEQERETFSHLIGFIQGRTYYNINNWYRSLSHFPFMDMNKTDMERMMGLQDPVDFVVDRHLSFWQKAKKLPLSLWIFLRLLQRFMTLDKRVENFQQHFKQIYTSVKRTELHTLQLSELHELRQYLRKSLLENWQVPIYNDIYIMMMNGKVRRLLEKAGIEDVEIVQNHLLAAEKDLESTQPMKALLAISQSLSEYPELCQALQSCAKSDCLALLQQENQTLYQACVDYIERYGDRCMGEQKFETITLRQDSSFMFTVIDNYLRQPDLTAERLGRSEKALREEAEYNALQAIEQKLGKAAVRKFQKALKNVRQGVQQREKMRMNRSRMFGLFRSIYVEMGEQFAFYGVLNRARDIFYLTTQELDDYFNGVSIQSNLKGLVALRQAEYQAYENEHPPHHFETQGMIYHHTPYRYEGDLEIEPEGEESELFGMGCYPGEVTAEVRLIEEASEEKSLHGHILCTKRTDPGWMPLFPSCSGILVERGSMLSHAAVVARELGIPTIVGIPGLTRILGDGDRVTLDGGSGRVVIHRQTI